MKLYASGQRKSFAPLKALLIAEHFNQPHGSALSAIDILRSIPSSYQKHVLSEHLIPFGPYLHGAIRHSWRFNRQFFPQRRLGKLFNTILARAHRFLLRRWLSNSDIDIIFINGFASRSLWREIHRFIPKQSVVVLISRESPRHFDQVDRAIAFEEQREFICSFNFHIFVSEILRHEWINIAGLKMERTYCLPNCCSEKRLLSICRQSPQSHHARDLHQIPHGVPLILNAGTIELRKGQQDLEQLAIYLQQKQIDFRIACVGFVATEDGLIFRRRVEESSVGRFFHFPGATDNMAEWYAAADLLVFTSRAEAMPRTVLEAMAAALPIVSTNVDGIPELIEHLREGYLYSPGDIQSLTQSVETIVNNPDGALLIASSARQKYITQFSQLRHSQRLGNILDMML